MKNKKCIFFVKCVITCTCKYLKLIEIQWNVLFLSVLMLNWVSEVIEKESLECGRNQMSIKNPIVSVGSATVLFGNIVASTQSINLM